MTRQRRYEHRRAKRRRRLLRTLLLGSAAIGLPALANAVIARRNRKLDSPAWGRPRRYAWTEGEISFQQIGDGPPVVLVHALGPGFDAEQWRDAALLIARRRRIYAVDLLGWGHSAKPAVEYDGELYIQLLKDFIEHIVRDRTALVGVGISASYAVQVATDVPELVSCLGVTCPRGLGESLAEPDLADALTNRALQLPLLGTSILNLYTARGMLARFLRRDIFALPDRVDAALVEHLYRSSHQPGSHRALAALLSGYLDHRVEPAVARLDVPVWLAWGRRSTSPVVETADLWLSRLPPAELEVFDDAGRLPHCEVPQAYADRLLSFLERVGS